jgi:GAF domain-containing protein
LFSGFDAPVPVRVGSDWESEAQVLASAQLQGSLLAPTSLIDVAETGAEYFREIFNARTVTIIVLKDSKYFDIVNVGYIPPGNYHYPSSRGYPTWEYPLATRQLDVGGGYFTRDVGDPHFQEYVRVWDDPDVTSIMGVGIVHDAELLGEIFHTRDDTRPPFDRSDLDLGRELGPTFASALSKAMARDAQR